jgi:hypothetical protein
VGEAVQVDAPSGYRHDAQQGYMDSSMRGGQKEGSWLREDAQHLRLGVAFLLNGSWQDNEGGILGLLDALWEEEGEPVL